MNYFFRSRRRIKSSKVTVSLENPITGNNQGLSRRRKSSIIKVQQNELDLQCLYRLEELCYSKMDSSVFWKEFLLSINSLYNIIDLEYLIKIYCTSLQYKTKGDFFRKSSRRSNDKFQHSVHEQFLERIQFQGSFQDLLQENNILAYLSFYHGCIFAVDLYCYMIGYKKNVEIKKPIKLEIIQQYFERLPQHNKIVDYQLNVLMRFTKLEFLLRDQKEHTTIFKKIHDYSTYKEDQIFPLDTSLLYIIIFVALKLVNFPITSEDFRRFYSKGIYPFFQDQNNQNQQEDINNTAHNKDLKFFLIEIRRPPNSQTIRDKQYHFLQFTFENDQNYFNFLENLSIRNTNIYFDIHEKYLFDLKYYHKLMLKTKEDLFSAKSSTIATCYERLYSLLISTKEGRALLTKYEEISLLALVMIIMKAFYGIGKKSPSLLLLKEKDLKHEKNRLGPKRYQKLLELISKTEIDTDKLIIETIKLEDQLDILYNWTQYMKTDQFDIFWERIQGKDVYNKKIKIPISYNDVNSMNKVTFFKKY